MDDIRDNRTMYTAEQVAQNIIDNGCKNFDFTDWQTVSEQDMANAFIELVAQISSFKADEALTHEGNLATYYIDLRDSIESTLASWAKDEIRKSGYVGMLED